MFWHLISETIIVSSLLLDLYLTGRQYRFVKAATSPNEIFKSHVTDDEFAKSKEYELETDRFGVIQTIFSTLVAVISVILMYPLWSIISVKSEVIHSLIFLVTSSLITSLLSVPFSYYQTFVIEAKYGLNNSTKKLFFTDQIKSYAISTIFTCIIFPIFLYLFRWAGTKIIIYGMILFFVLTIVIQIIYPLLIMPLFTKLTPLPDGEVKDSITKLAESCDFPISGLFQTDDSKRSSKQGAYTFGLFKHRVCIFDTAMKTCTADDICAIVGHEVGHCKYHHLWKQLIINQFDVALFLYAMKKIMECHSIFSEFGFSEEAPLVIGISFVSTLMTPINTILSLPLNMLSRHFEYQADEYAAKRGLRLDEALMKVVKENKQVIDDEPLYSAFSSSHPTVPQRVENIRKNLKKTQ